MHVFGGILCGARAKAVEAEGIFIRAATLVVVIFTACVQLAEDQIPVPAFLLFVVAQRNAAPVVVHLNGAIQKSRDGDQLAVTLTGLVH